MFGAAKRNERPTNAELPKCNSPPQSRRLHKQPAQPLTSRISSPDVFPRDPRDEKRVWRFPQRLNVYQCFIRFKKKPAECLTRSDNYAILHPGGPSPPTVLSVLPGNAE